MGNRIATEPDSSTTSTTTTKTRRQIRLGTKHRQRRNNHRANKNYLSSSARDPTNATAPKKLLRPEIATTKQATNRATPKRIKRFSSASTTASDKSPSTTSTRKKGHRTTMRLALNLGILLFCTYNICTSLKDVGINLEMDAWTVMTNPESWMSPLNVTTNTTCINITDSVMVGWNQSSKDDQDGQDGIVKESIVKAEDIGLALAHASMMIQQQQLNNTESQQQQQPDDDGIAACLLLLEDSIQLIEWIAYHYTTLPLSSLVIGLDPKNSNRTIDILNKLVATWNDTVGLEIQTWHYPHYMMDPNRLIPPTKKGRETSTALEEHRWRQKNFHNKCAFYHRKAGRQWTVAIDTDEFVVYNYLNPLDEDLNKTTGRHFNYSKAIRAQLLPQFRNRTVLDFLRLIESVYKQNHTLEEQVQATKWSFLPNPCIRMVGLSFSNKKTIHNISSTQNNNTNATDETKVGDDDLNRNNMLMTASYHTTALPNRYFTKIIYDVSKIPLSKMQLAHYRNVHSKWKFGCGGDFGGVPDYSSAVFRVNHYCGSLASYLQRDADARGRTKKMYKAKIKSLGKLSKWKDHATDGWVDRFLQKVGGSDIANQLLFEPLQAELDFARKRLVAQENGNVTMDATTPENTATSDRRSSGNDGNNFVSELVAQFKNAFYSRRKKQDDAIVE